MKILSRLRLWTLALLPEKLSMSKSGEKVYYAVGRGKETGIYDTWAECKAQTDGITNAKFRKFYSLDEAEEFVNFWKNYSSPAKDSDGSITPDELVEKPKEEKSSGLQSIQANETLNNYYSSSPSLKPCVCIHPPSPRQSNYCDEKCDQRTVEVLALNLRLDSFEKRLDSCLKEIGVITSEISHLKTSIVELKNNLMNGGSPKKGRDGMLQTTLSFGNSCGSSSPSKYTKENSSNSTENEKTRGRSLKRKLSKSSVPESPKRFADESAALDNLLSRVKTESVDLTSFNIDDEGFVEVYTDGAAQFNGKEIAKAGIGIWFGDNHPMNVAEPVIGPPTNNTAEIQAARVAVQLAAKAGITKLKIITDSEFLINCATKWIHRWKKNGWKLRDGGPVKNRTELEKLDEAASQLIVRWEKVAGHSGVKGNETADRLANDGASRYQR